MKTWQKMVIVFVGGGLVWAMSFLASIKPDLSMILASANATVVGLVSYLTGFKAD